MAFTFSRPVRQEQTSDPRMAIAEGGQRMAQTVGRIGDIVSQSEARQSKEASDAAKLAEDTRRFQAEEKRKNTQIDLESKYKTALTSQASKDSELRGLDIARKTEEAADREKERKATADAKALEKQEMKASYTRYQELAAKNPKDELGNIKKSGLGLYPKLAEVVVETYNAGKEGRRGLTLDEQLKLAEARRARPTTKKEKAPPLTITSPQDYANAVDLFIKGKEAYSNQDTMRRKSASGTEGKLSQKDAEFLSDLRDLLLNANPQVVDTAAYAKLVRDLQTTKIFGREMNFGSNSE